MKATDELRAFGRLVKTRRQAARLSLERLAVLCQVSSSTLKNVERGRSSLATCAALLATPELQLTIDDMPLFAQPSLDRHRSSTSILRLSLSVTDFAAREQVLAGVIRFASSRELSELGEWAEAKLRSLHRLRAALIGSDELLPAWRACGSSDRSCVGFADLERCGGS